MYTRQHAWASNKSLHKVLRANGGWTVMEYGVADTVEVRLLESTVSQQFRRFYAFTKGKCPTLHSLRRQALLLDKFCVSGWSSHAIVLPTP